MLIAIVIVSIVLIGVLATITLVAVFSAIDEHFKERFRK